MEAGFTSTLCLVSVLSRGVLDQSFSLAVTGPYPNAHELTGPMPNGSGQDSDQGPMAYGPHVCSPGDKESECGWKMWSPLYES